MRIHVLLCLLLFSACQPAKLQRGYLAEGSSAIDQKAELLRGTWYNTDRSGCDYYFEDPPADCADWKHAFNFYETRYVERLVDGNNMTVLTPKYYNITFLDEDTYQKEGGSIRNFKITGNELEICDPGFECYRFFR